MTNAELFSEIFGKSIVSIATMSFDELVDWCSREVLTCNSCNSLSLEDCKGCWIAEWNVRNEIC